jgi:2-succinyl-6-hydroxy-2,4-cyclohexadiene-1-carboxylate synthase
MTFLALHGFTQRGTMWAEVAPLVGGEWAAPDLPGHGDVPACDWDEAVAKIGGQLAGMASPRCLVGYSMGGRLALGTALAHPGLVERLALISAGPGLAGAGERRRRRRRDQALAAHIEAVGMPAFAREWLAQPIFAGLRDRPAEWRKVDLAARAGNRAEGVAESLRRLGQGRQPYLGGRLGELAMPFLVVVGGKDARYLKLGRRLVVQSPGAVLAEVPGAGHAVVGERPAELAAVLAPWVAG